MRKLMLTLGMTALLITLAVGQNLQQTVRGTIIDVDSKLPLIGAEVMILDSYPIIGTVSNVAGEFRLEAVPVGRVTLQISYLGYENKTIPNLIINSGKEAVLQITMEESVIKIAEVVVQAHKNKGAAVDDMALLSARSISAEQTKRFAGGFDDPSRILSNFAGVTNTQNSENDIIVRGNSPKYIQWQLEGIEISNPSHFGDQNAAKGGISALNNNLLATSDFYTGAFAPAYGDVLSGVYDVKLRTGNNEKREATFGFGLIGTDFTLEGPFKENYGGSYLINYRYSTISLITKLGLTDINGALNYQDMTFKVVLPTKQAGVFSFFGLGGLSNFLVKEVTPDLWTTPTNTTNAAEVREDYDKANHLMNLGMNHTYSLNTNSYLKTSLAFSSTGIEESIFQSKDSLANKFLNLNGNLINSTYRAAITYNNKINAKHKIQIGTKYALFDYDYIQNRFQEERASDFTVIDFKEQLSTIRNFVSWKYRITDRLTLVTGLHNMNVLFNNKSTLESRMAINWKLNNTNTINFGWGEHSKMESVHNYFAKVEQADETTTEPNRDLGLLKAKHFVVGYEKRFTENLRLKVEGYYQKLSDLPVENIDTSYYATINESTDFRYVDLVNEGTGENYGIELTLERFLANNYYFLLNGSLYESTYKSLEGVKRNTLYNGNYLVNFLLGKEFVNLGKKKNKTLALNAKVFYGGGQKYIPLLRDEQGSIAVQPEKNLFFDYEKAYTDKIEDIFQVDLSISYRINKPRATHEFFLNLVNLTNNKGKLTEYYNENEPNSVGHVTQFGIFPNLLYRVYF